MSTKEDPEFNQLTGKWEYEGEDGTTFEKDPSSGKWISVIDEELLKKQQAAYSVDGVDESVPAVKKKEKKRKVYTGDNEAEETATTTNKAKTDPAAKPKETSIYVTGLPKDVTVDELNAAFSKCGLIQEDAQVGGPRIKIYRNEQGEIKGDALIIYFREESVLLAEQMLDDAELRPGEANSRMKVQKATFAHKPTSEPVQKKQKSQEEKKKSAKKVQKLNSKLADWEEDAPEVAPKSRSGKVVVLKAMFSLAELDDEPSLLLDLKEDVRDECSKIGDVTNVVLFDKEPDGIMTVRFSTEEAAGKCIAAMDGRYFGGRTVAAELYDGKRRYQKAGKDANENGDVSEEVRLESFGKWLEEDSKEESAAP